jgi:hypothetical protein
MKSMSDISVAVTTQSTWFAKVRVAARQALTLHLQYCETFAQAHRRQQ